MSFMREDKMTSSNAKKGSWKFQRIKFNVPLKLFSIWSYLGFIQIIFLKNKINGKQGKMIHYIKKLERNNFDISKMILLGFIVEVALFELFEFL